MGVLLDTDVVSNLMSARPSSSLTEKLAQVDGRDQFTSSITVGEIVYGAHRSSRSDQLLRALDVVLPRMNVLSFEAAAAHIYGALRLDLERSGRRLAEADLRIASIALRDRHILVTGNVRHFARIPELAVENWLAG